MKQGYGVSKNSKMINHKVRYRVSMTLKLQLSKAHFKLDKVKDEFII